MEKDMHQQRCPLCSNPSEYRLIQQKKTKHFYCTNCGQFQISFDAEKLLEKGPAHWKINLPKLARDHPYGNTLVIALADDNDPVPLFHKYVENSELPE
jgi:hypothetical protein